MKKRKSFAERLDDQREEIWAEAGERRGSIPLLVAVVGAILILYFLTAEKPPDEPEKFVVGTVVSSEEIEIDKYFISHLKVKLPDKSLVEVKLPKFVYPQIGARMKVYIDRETTDGNGDPIYRYVDYLN